MKLLSIVRKDEKDVRREITGRKPGVTADLIKGRKDDDQVEDEDENQESDQAQDETDPPAREQIELRRRRPPPSKLLQSD